MNDAGSSTMPESNFPPESSTPGSATPPSNLLSTGNLPKIKKQYKPPQADKNTFRTQEEFLSSLTPIPIETVDQINRKCPTCWKPYGEAADLGFDNSEQPVQLRCKHIFGDKCLKVTFALPKTTTLELRQLTFTPGSKGHTLGYNLHKYAEKQDKGPSEEAHFLQMLEDSYVPQAGRKFFGDYWWAVLEEIQRTMHNTSGIILLDNAVILDNSSAKEVPNLYPGPPTSSPGTLHIVGPAWQNNAINVAESWKAKPLTPTPDFCTYTNKTTETETGKIWGEALISNPQLDKHITEQAYKKKQEELQQQEWKAELERIRLAELKKKRSDEKQRLRARFNQIIAAELVSVYASYHKNDAETVSEPSVFSDPTHFLYPSTKIHKSKLHSTSVEVSYLDRMPPSIDTDGDGEDDDGNDNNHERTDDINNAIIILSRSICDRCFKNSEISNGVRSAETPTQLWWKDKRKVPDGCPICNSVLFRKDVSNVRSKETLAPLLDVLNV